MPDPTLMDATLFLKMLEEKINDKREEATELLLRGETIKAAASAGQVKACQDLQRTIRFRMEALERMRIEAERKLRASLERKELRRLEKEASKGKAA